jgi:hypothetical protein
MSFAAQLFCSLGWRWDDGAQDNDSLRTPGQNGITLGQGNSDNEAEAVWHLEDVVLSSGDAVEYDLTNLTRTILGDEHIVAYQRIKAILIQLTAASDGSLVVGAANIDPWLGPFGRIGDTIKAEPGSPLFMANIQDGWPVWALSASSSSSSSGDSQSDRMLRLEASGGDVTFSIAIVGETTPRTDSSSSSSSSS